MTRVRVELICFGTELLRDKVNSNVVTVAERLGRVGLALERCVTVGDDAAECLAALRESWRRSDVVLTSGGLGPTFDDLTRECAARLLGRPLAFSKPLLRAIEARFRSVRRAMPEENRRQAYLIRGARPIANRVGTAPGQVFERGGKCLVLLPGPPNELSPMLDREVCPLLKRRYSRSVSRTLVLHVFGRPESEVDERIAPVVEKDWSAPGLRVVFGILAHRSIIDVKATAEWGNAERADQRLAEIRSELLPILGDDLYGQNEETLEGVVGKLLAKRGETLALAESCTGGLIADKITAVPGSSRYFLEGRVTYSNESKMKLLGVRRETLEKFGAVSRETAEEMARGLLKRAGSDWAVSVTGIAGPGGGTREKPVGLVWFAVASRGRLISRSRNLFGNRQEIKDRSALSALNLLRLELLKPRR